MLRLSENDQKILGIVELNARAPIELIQKHTKLRPYTIRYALRQLQDKKIISPQIWVDLSQLGLMHVFCFFSATFLEKHSRGDLNLFLCQCPKVYWFAEIAGEYQFELGLVVSTAEEALEFFNATPSQCGMLFAKKEIFFRTSMTLYSRRYSNIHKKTTLKSIKAKGRKQITDSIDMQILARLSHSPLESNREMANHLNLSPATINTRANNLKINGIIAGFWYLVNSELITSRMYYLQIYTRGFDNEMAKRLEEFALDHPLIIFCHNGLGAWDFQLHAEVSKGEDLSRLVELLYEHFHQEIITIRVFSRLKVLKCSMLG